LRRPIKKRSLLDVFDMVNDGIEKAFGMPSEGGFNKASSDGVGVHEAHEEGSDGLNVRPIGKPRGSDGDNEGAPPCEVQKDKGDRGSWPA
jgi:hypothetical protein